MFMNFGSAGAFINEIPTGTWNVKFNGEILGKFDLGIAYPLVQDRHDATKQVPRVYMPVARISRVANSERIEKVEIWFDLYDQETGSYKRVTNYDAMKKMVAGFNVSIAAQLADNSSWVTDGHATGSLMEFPEDGEPLTIDLTKEWRVKSTDLFNCPDPSGYYRADQITIDYYMYENRYRTNFKLPTDYMASCP